MHLIQQAMQAYILAEKLIVNLSIACLRPRSKSNEDNVKPLKKKKKRKKEFKKCDNSLFSALKYTLYC